jgi:hypothetical protein
MLVWTFLNKNMHKYFFGKNLLNGLFAKKKFNVLNEK